MHSVFPKTVWLLVIALIAQLVTVAGVNAHQGNLVSQSPSAVNVDQSTHHPVAKSMNMEHGSGCASMMADDGSKSPANKSCDGQNNCHLQHCSAVHALAKGFPSSLFVDLNQAWPRFSPSTLLLPLPPQGQPPKIA